MSRKQSDERGKQKGAQAHAEGQHGAKTHDRFLEEIHAAGAEERTDVERRDEAGRDDHPADGEHRLFEGREQRDEGERASERTRLDRDNQRHDHGRSGGDATASERVEPGRPGGGSRRE